MSITYANLDRHPMIETNRASANLVTGWITYADDSERLYAVHADGRVKCTNWLKRGQPDFNKAGRKWADVGGPVPAEAVYCGNYAPDMF